MAAPNPQARTFAGYRPTNRLQSSRRDVQRWSAEGPEGTAEVFLGPEDLVAEAEAVPRGGPFADLTWGVDDDGAWVVSRSPLKVPLTALRRPLEDPQAFAIALLVAEALRGVHDAGSWHGHLHPEGIGFDDGGVLCIRPALHFPMMKETGADPVGPATDCRALGAIVRYLQGEVWPPKMVAPLEVEGLDQSRSLLVLTGMLRERSRVRLQPARALVQALSALFHTSEVRSDKVVAELLADFGLGSGLRSTAPVEVAPPRAVPAQAGSPRVVTRNEAERQAERIRLEEAARTEALRADEERARREAEAQERAIAEAQARVDAERREAELRKQFEEEARRRVEEEVRARLEAEATRAREEAAARQAAEEARNAAFQEQLRQLEEERKHLEQERLAAENARKQAETDRLKAEAEARRAEEALQREAEKRAADEARREAEDRARREAEAARRAEEERKKAEEARKRADEARAAAERKRSARTRKAAAKAQKEAEEEARRIEEAQRKAEEEQRLAEEERRKAEEASRAAAEAARLAEEARKEREAARLKALDEARQREEEEAKQRAAERAKREAEAEARRVAEQRARDEAREKARLEAEARTRRAEERAREAEEARKAAQARIEAERAAAEKARKAREARAAERARLEAEQAAEDAKRAEQARVEAERRAGERAEAERKEASRKEAAERAAAQQAEHARKAEQARVEAARKAEAVRKAAQAEKAEAAKRAEATKKAAQAKMGEAPKKKRGPPEPVQLDTPLEPAEVKVARQQDKGLVTQAADGDEGAKKHRPSGTSDSVKEPSSSDILYGAAEVESILGGREGGPERTGDWMLGDKVGVSADSAKREQELGSGKWGAEGDRARSATDIAKVLPSTPAREMQIDDDPMPLGKIGLAAGGVLLLLVGGFAWLSSAGDTASAPEEAATAEPSEGSSVAAVREGDWIMVTTDPADARITFDGSDYGKAPAEVPLADDEEPHELCIHKGDLNSCRQLTATEMAASDPYHFDGDG